MKMKKKNKKNKNIEVALDLVRHHLHDIIRHPSKLNQIPNNSTVVLFPVPVAPRKAA